MALLFFKRILLCILATSAFMWPSVTACLCVRITVYNYTHDPVCVCVCRHVSGSLYTSSVSPFQVDDYCFLWTAQYLIRQ